MIPATPSMHENHAFDQSSAFFWSSSFFALPWAVSHVSVTWIFLRRHSRSSLSLSSFFVFTFAWDLWWGWPDFMKLRSSGVGLNSEQWQCCNLPSSQPFPISNWHFWQMVQMSAQCLLSKTEKAQISGQMQIICTGWQHSAMQWYSILLYGLLVILGHLPHLTGLRSLPPLEGKG